MTWIELDARSYQKFRTLQTFFNILTSLRNSARKKGLTVKSFINLFAKLETLKVNTKRQMCTREHEMIPLVVQKTSPGDFRGKEFVG